MAQRLPTPGGDAGSWGSILNGFLQVSHNSDGSLIPQAVTDAGAYNKPLSGIPATDLDSSTQTTLSSVANKYVKPVGGIPYTDIAGNLPLSYLNTTGSANGTTYLRGDGTWSSVPAPSNATNLVPGLIELSNDLGGSATAPTVVSTHLTSALPVDQGGTGSITQNFVDLSTGQTIDGAKTFTSIITANISGSASTVTTIPALSGDVSSSGSSNVTNVTKINGIGLPVSAPTASGQILATTGSGASTSTSWITPAAGVTLDSTASDIQPLGSQSAGASSQAAKADHVHAMPRLDQVSAPTSSLSLNSQKITGLANGTLATDAAAFGQIPIAGTSGSTYAAGNDSRITGALQKSSNLSDLTSASTARTNLGLGSAATLASSAFDAAGAATAVQANNINPATFGYFGWTADPTISSANATPTVTRIYLMRFRAVSTGNCGHLVYSIEANGSSLTSGQNFVGIYDTGQTSAGVATLLAASADLTSTWTSATTYTTALTSSASLTAGQDYFAAFLVNGTTAPAFYRAYGAVTALINAGLSGLSLRVAHNSSSAFTSLPATMAAANVTIATDCLPYCFIATT